MTCFLCCHVILDGCIIIKEEFFMTCCIWRVLHLRGSIHFLILVHAFLSSMLSGGVHVFRGSLLHILRESLWALCSLLLFYWLCVLVSVVLSRCPYLWGPRFFQVDLAFVMPLMRVTLILIFMRHLFTWIWIFACLSIPWMRFSAFASQTISCALMLSTHSSRGW